MIPFDDVVKMGRREFIYRRVFSVNLDLTRFCNYSCSYCWPESHSSIKDYRSPDLLLQAVNEVKRQAKANGFVGFIYTLSGGEPTLYPGLHTILADLQSDTDCYQAIDLVTNLSQGSRWWHEFAKATAQIHYVGITGSWHREAGRNDLINHRQKFCDKLLQLEAARITTVINIVMVPEWWNELWDDAIFFREHDLRVSLKMQSGGNPYSAEQIRLMQTGFPCKPVSPRFDHPLGALPDVGPGAYQELQAADGHIAYLNSSARLNALGYNRFEGWDCAAGFQSVMIREPQGTVSRAVACRDVPLGTIETGFQLFDTPKPCITPCCSCLFDLELPKTRHEFAREETNQ